MVSKMLRYAHLTQQTSVWHSIPALRRPLVCGALLLDDLGHGQVPGLPQSRNILDPGRAFPEHPVVDAPVYVRPSPPRPSPRQPWPRATMRSDMCVLINTVMCTGRGGILSLSVLIYPRLSFSREDNGSQQQRHYC